MQKQRLQIFLFVLSSKLARAVDHQNITISVPKNFSNHGRDDLFCVPARWYQILIFFAVNYISHAATVKSRPGQMLYRAAGDFLLALAFPFSGVLRAIESFSRFSWPNKNDLVKATRAGALCVVVRNSDWQRIGFSRSSTTQYRQQLEDEAIVGSADYQPPYYSRVNTLQLGDNVSQPHISEEIALEYLPSRTTTFDDKNAYGRGKPFMKSAIAPNAIADDSKPLFRQYESHCWRNEVKTIITRGSQSYRRIHGTCRLPSGYSLAWLPNNARVINPTGNDAGANITICSSYNFPKAIIALVQSIYGSVTLYHARGDQILRYGYVSFGLTVIPYIIMSIVNLCSSLLLPDYPTIYIVRSPEMDEAIAQGGQIDGTIGRVLPNIVLDAPSIDETSTLRLDDQSLSIEPFNSLRSDTERIKSEEAFSEIRSVNYISPVAHLWKSTLPAYQTVGPERWTLRTRTLATHVAAHLIGAIPFAINAALTHYDPGKSTDAQRVWIMVWLVCGVTIGPLLEGRFNMHLLDPKDEHKFLFNVLTVVGFLIYAPVPIGAFVVVAKMIKEYGSCISLAELGT